MQRKMRLAPLAVIAVAAIALSACGSSGSSKSSGKSSGAPTGASAAPSGASTAAADVPSIFPTEQAGAGTLVYGADQEPTGFNNATSKDNGTAAANITESTWPSASYGQPNLVPAFNKYLFTSDPVQTSTSPQTIEYKINPKAMWSDGVAIDEKDFEFNWKAQNGTDKNYDVASSSGYSQISSVKAGPGGADDVIVTYSKPYSDWAGLFSPLLPAHTIIAQEPKFGGSVEKAWNDGLDANPLVSGGPYTVSSYKVGDNLVLEPNPKWYGPAPKLSKITFRFLPESITQPQALQNKEVQMIYPQPQLDEVAQIAKLPNVKSELNFGLSFEHIDFNLKKPGLDDLVVRQAITTAIDRKAIIARTVGQFSNKAQPEGNSVFVNNQPAYQDHTPAGTTTGDAAAAKKMLEGDGYALGSDGYYAKAGKTLDFKFTTTAGNALRQQTATLFQAEMKTAGIKIDLDIRPSKVVFPDLSAHKFDISLFAWVNTTFPAAGTQQLYATGSDSNYGSIADPAIDAASTKAVGDTDSAAEDADLNHVDTLLWKGAYTIPLFQKPTYIAYTDNFVNIHDNPTSDGPFYNAYTWGVKTQ